MILFKAQTSINPLCVFFCFLRPFLTLLVTGKAMANGSVANGKAKTPLPANPLGNFCTNIVGLHYIVNLFLSKCQAIAAGFPKRAGHLSFG